MTRTDIRPVTISPEQTDSANQAPRQVRSYLEAHRDHREITVATVAVAGGEPESLTLPREAVELLAGPLAHLGGPVLVQLRPGGV
jgi:hypothetical protein